MYINESAKLAHEINGAIRRESWPTSWSIIPTNDPRRLCEAKAKGDVARGWQPKLDDLIADDWVATTV